jgi:hypothetical protein
MRAQVWFEWRWCGRLYLISVTLSIVAWMVLGALLEHNQDRRVGYGAVFLAAHTVIAVFWGPLLGTSGESVRKHLGLSGFCATRPMSNLRLVAAKFWTAGIISLLGWLVAVAAFVGWQAWAGGFSGIAGKYDAIRAELGPARAAAIGIALALGPVLIAWRMMVVNVVVGLTGRPWIIATQGIAASAIGLQLLYEWTLWGVDPVRTGRIVDALPWLGGFAVGLKCVAAAALLRVLVRRRELSAGLAGRVVAIWAVTAASLFALLAWLVPEGAVPRYGLAFGAVLAVPLARLLAAPIALAWNRHR